MVAPIVGKKISITVQSSSQTADGQGGFLNTWPTRTGYPVKGIIAEMKGQERVLGGKDNVVVQFLCVIPYDSGVTFKMRISAGGGLYDIVSINNPNMLNHHLELGLVRRDT